MLRQALKLLQHRALQPAVSALTSKDVAVHTLLQDWKSSLQTRTLSLPALHAEGVGWSDRAGGIGFPFEGAGTLVWASTIIGCKQSTNPRTKSAILIISTACTFDVTLFGKTGSHFSQIPLLESPLRWPSPSSAS